MRRAGAAETCADSFGLASLGRAGGIRPRESPVWAAIASPIPRPSPQDTDCREAQRRLDWPSETKEARYESGLPLSFRRATASGWGPLSRVTACHEPTTRQKLRQVHGYPLLS